MFYNFNLDDRTCHEIESDAVFHIPGEYPEWTNYNPSDPGITLIQLFAWLKEVQQYHLSQIGSSKRLKYLKLLGIEAEHIRPALGAVNVEPGPDQFKTELTLPKGTRFFAENMPFETVEKETIHPTRFIGAYMVQGETLSRYHNIGNDFDKQIRIYPFGETPETGNQCCFVLDRALSGTFKTDIYFDVRTDYEVTRNPVDDDFIPLAKLKWEYQSEDGWTDMQVEYDHTHELIQSGSIRFHIPKEMAPDRSFDAYQIRVTLIENNYDVAPLIRNIRVNEIEVKQQYTLCDYEDYEIEWKENEDEMLSFCSDLYLAENGQAELYLKGKDGWILETEIIRESVPCGGVRIRFRKPDWASGRLLCRLAVWEEEWTDKRIIGVGDAFANQEYGLHISDIVYDEFEILVHDEESGVFQPYRRVEDFDNCTPEDPACILDLDGRKVLFGNCERGMAPDGEIKVIRLRTSFGKSGNIKANKIRTCEAYPELLVKQYRSTEGGRDNETLEQCFERLRRKIRSVGRGVTYSDYEELVKNTPGLLILDSRVISPKEWEKEGKKPAENQISIVVQPLSYMKRNACLNKKYRQNLLQMLQKRKMLGTRIRLLNPEYVGISVYAEIAIKPQFQDAEQQIDQAVKEYLDEKTWKIGQPVLSSTMYGILDTLSCVWQVRTLSFNAMGKGVRRLVNGDVGLPPNGLAYLKELDFSIYTADLR